MSPLTKEQVVEVAEELLSSRFGGSQQLSDIEDLGGSGNAVVLRARVANSPFLPHRTVVLKYIPETGHPFEDASLLRELVAYQFTTSLAENVRPGPVLLAHDIAQRIVVLTDSGDGYTLAELLASSDDTKRVHLLRELGTALGAMHAGTAGREDGYDILFSRMQRNHPEYGESKGLRDNVFRASIIMGLQLLEAADLKSPAVVSQLAQEAASSLSSSQSRAFTPFDLSPDNIIVADKIHFLDYEWAGFRNVIFDVACVIAGFPQFLFARPIQDSEVDVFVNAWAREVKSMWPRLAEETYLHASITSALVGWALSSVTAMSIGGIEELLAVPEVVDAQELDRESTDVAARLLGQESDGPYTEDELLIRRDLYETFEALARFSAHGSEAECSHGSCDTVHDFSARVAARLQKPGL